MSKTILIETQESKKTRVILENIVSVTKRVFIQQFGAAVGPYTGSLKLMGHSYKIKPVDYDLIVKALDDNGITSIEVSHLGGGKTVVVADTITSIRRARAADNVPGVAGEHDELLLSNGDVIALKAGDNLMDAIEGILSINTDTNTEKEVSNE